MSDENRPDALMRLEEVANRLSVSSRSLARMLARGEIPTVTMGRRRLVRRSAFEAFLASLAGDRPQQAEGAAE